MTGPPGAGRPASGVPWQFVFRAACVITGLVLLLLVDVRGAAFYVAWSLIGLALASEAAATLVYRLRPCARAWGPMRGGCSG